LKDYFKLSQINRYLTPVYLFILLILFLYMVLWLLIYPGKLKTIEKYRYFRRRLLNPVIMVLLATVLFSVFYFMAANTFYTVKSYWDSYKKYIKAQNLDEAYYGFYDFEKFIFWADSKIEPGENLVVLLRGEPVYIMAELAYNLYPRDIKFLDIGGKESQDIYSNIIGMSRLAEEDEACETDKPGKRSNYRYILALTDTGIIDLEKFELLYKYRDTGGFIYRIK